MSPIGPTLANMEVLLQTDTTHISMALSLQTAWATCLDPSLVQPYLTGNILSGLKWLEISARFPQTFISLFAV